MGSGLISAVGSSLGDRFAGAVAGVFRHACGGLALHTGSHELLGQPVMDFIGNQLVFLIVGPQ